MVGWQHTAQPSVSSFLSCTIFPIPPEVPPTTHLGPCGTCRSPLLLNLALPTASGDGQNMTEVVEIVAEVIEMAADGLSAAERSSSR